jgi:glutamate-1-semialdehyde 2,1-aminomutase
VLPPHAALEKSKKTHVSEYLMQKCQALESFGYDVISNGPYFISFCKQSFDILYTNCQPLISNIHPFGDWVSDADRYIAGGVVSLNRKVSPSIIFAHAHGSKLYDVDGKEYTDYHAAFAPHMLGHNYLEVNEAVKQAMNDNWSLFGSGTNAMEVALAKTMCEVIPGLQKIQVTNSGSEATAHAIRLSRAFTGREHIVLMLGGYNGWHNEVARLVMPSRAQAGPRQVRGEYRFMPSSAGIPAGAQALVHVINFNDLDSLEYVLQSHQIACVLTEPVLQNIGVVLPREGYLKGLVDLCRKYGAVSIFDEVKTGFRSALGGYQSIAGVTPDLSVFGKAIANGFPLGVIGGRHELMNLFDDPDPSKRVLIAGTYNAHPFNVAAALATIDILKRQEVYQYLSAVSSRLYEGLSNIFKEKGLPMTLASNQSAFCTYLMEKLPHDLHDILEHHDFELDLKIRKMLIEKGIYHIPIACKQGSISYSHTISDIDITLQATREVLQKI